MGHLKTVHYEHWNVFKTSLYFYTLMYKSTWAEFINSKCDRSAHCQWVINHDGL